MLDTVVISGEDVCCGVVFVNVYLDHLKLCVVCIHGRMYVCCKECYVVTNERNEPTPDLCNLLVLTVVELCLG